MFNKKSLTKSLTFALTTFFNIFAAVTALAFLIFLGYLTYQYGQAAGYNQAVKDMGQQIANPNPSQDTRSPAFQPAQKPPTDQKPTTAPPPTSQKPKGFSGPKLWEAVNTSRINHGVNPLKQLDVFCTVASIRLNQQLELGKLDNHAGFEPTLNQIEKAKEYNIAEYLVYTTGTATDAVNLWLNTLGHRSLLTGGEYVWGCTYAQAGFGVAITGY